MSVYADHAATTPMREAAKKAMIECLDIFGNPSSVHAAGRLAAMKLESARKEVAEMLNCRPAEIYFTSGGSEADNWAVKSAIAGGVVTSAFEHHAILHTLGALKTEEGRPVAVVKPGADGIVSPDDVVAGIDKNTTLVTIMTANNEVGTIQPISDIARLAHKRGAFFHTDAVQAVGHIKVDVQRMGVDMLSLSGHKFGGPKGVGALYCRSGIPLAPLMFGGGQERGRRPGTENLPAIVAMAAAMREACENIDAAAEKTSRLRDGLVERILAIPGSHIHGSMISRLPGNVSCSFDGVEGEAAVIMLDLAGVCVSAGSACTSGSGEPSHVLTAMGLPKRAAYGAIRITLSEQNTAQEIGYISDQLTDVVEKLRA